MAYEQFLKSVEPFQALTPGRIRMLAGQCRLQNFKAGAHIISRGDPGDSMFIIHAGEVRIPVLDAAGREKFVARLGSREFFGEMALLTGENRSADVFAETDVDVLVIHKAPLQAFLRQTPQVASFLTEILGQRLMENDQIRQVGKYKLLGELGRGGMAIVYEGLHPTLGRTVAVKMLSHELVYDQEFATRFKNEAKIIARLEHKNIVHVFDYEEVYATYFIIMEKVEGTDLGLTLESQGVLPFDKTRTILSQLASGLSYAHEHGVIHRDVKPSNVILDSDGVVKLMDFGIAKERSEEEEAEEDIIGTAEYMSPEQALGHKMDGRADIYSLGIMAFEMLTGRLPFDSHDPYEILRKHIREAIVPPNQINPNVPPDLNELVMKACSKQPKDRFNNAQLISEFLEKHMGKTEGGFDPSQMRAKTLTILYQADPETGRRVEDAVRAFVNGAKKVPGVTIGFGDTTF
jgi:eukaryotic-like serine/threonine-protein kinase